MLNDLNFLTRNDPSGMAGLVSGFSEQVRAAYNLAASTAINLSGPFNHVVLTGLGGSAAGGDLVAALFLTEGKVPFFVNRDYQVPSFVGPGSLVFASSYSGNTEETLAAYADAKSKGATVIIVSSGGKLTELAKVREECLFEVPGGQPPRSAMGYMSVPVIVACQRLGLLERQDFDQVVAALEATAGLCGFYLPEDTNPAKQVAKQLQGKLGVLYGAGAWQYAVAQRWRGQINENAKAMVATHVFPELCHNEILGWQGAKNQGVAAWEGVLLLGGDESAQMLRRIEVTLGLIGDVCPFSRVQALGESTLARILSLAHMGDWVSLYLAALAGEDPGQMKAIDTLKARLTDPAS